MKTIQGIIVSDKSDKTRTVEVVREKQHKKYHKYYRITKRFKAHDENNEYRVGDKVVIKETRPLSKEKRWKIIGLSTNNESIANKRIIKSYE